MPSSYRLVSYILVLILLLEAIILTLSYRQVNVKLLGLRTLKPKSYVNSVRSLPTALH